MTRMTQLRHWPLKDSASQLELGSPFRRSEFDALMAQVESRISPGPEAGEGRISTVEGWVALSGVWVVATVAS